MENVSSNEGKTPPANPSSSTAADGQIQEAPIPDPERAGLLQILNANKTGWERPALANGKLSDHDEPTSLDLLVFAVRFGLRMRGVNWTQQTKFGTWAMDRWDVQEEFATYQMPSHEGSATGDRAVDSVGASVTHGLAWIRRQGPAARPALLPRPRGRYNRFVYYALARMIAEFDSRFTNQFAVELSQKVPVHEDTQSILGQNLKAIRNDLFAAGVQWGRIVAAFTLAAAQGYVCVKSEKPHLIDQLVSEMHQVFFMETINPWVAGHGGWVWMLRISFLFIPLF